VTEIDPIYTLFPNIHNLRLFVTNRLVDEPRSIARQRIYCLLVLAGRGVHFFVQFEQKAFVGRELSVRIAVA